MQLYFDKLSNYEFYPYDREACSRFLELWKRKHENGQWLEIEAAEATSTQSDLSAMNTSGVVLSGVANTYNDSNCELASENYGKSGSDVNAGER